MKEINTSFKKGLDILQDNFFEIAKARAEHGAFKIDNALKHAAGEILEAQESLDWFEKVKSDKFYSETDQEVARGNLAMELADAVYCLMTSASLNGIKLSDALIMGYAKEKARAEGHGDKL